MTKPKAVRVPVSNRILRFDAVLEKTGMRRTMLDNKRKTDPRFPRAIPLNKRAVGFLESEIDAYIALIAKERV